MATTHARAVARASSSYYRYRNPSTYVVHWWTLRVPGAQTTLLLVVACSSRSGVQEARCPSCRPSADNLAAGICARPRTCRTAPMSMSHGPVAIRMKGAHCSQLLSRGSRCAGQWLRNQPPQCWYPTRPHSPSGGTILHAAVKRRKIGFS